MYIACLLHNRKVLFSIFSWIFFAFYRLQQSMAVATFWYCFICFWFLPRSVIRNSLSDLTNFILEVHSLQFNFVRFDFIAYFILSSLAANIPPSMHCWKSGEISFNVNVQIVNCNACQLPIYTHLSIWQFSILCWKLCVCNFFLGFFLTCNFAVHPSFGWGFANSRRTELVTMSDVEGAERWNEINSLN